MRAWEHKYWYVICLFQLLKTTWIIKYLKAKRCKKLTMFLRALGIFVVLGLSVAIPTTKKYRGPSQESIDQAKAILDKYPIIDG